MAIYSKFIIFKMDIPQTKIEKLFPTKSSWFWPIFEKNPHFMHNPIEGNRIYLYPGDEWQPCHDTRYKSFLSLNFPLVLEFVGISGLSNFAFSLLLSPQQNGIDSSNQVNKIDRSTMWEREEGNWKFLPQLSPLRSPQEIWYASCRKNVFLFLGRTRADVFLRNCVIT